MPSAVTIDDLPIDVNVQWAVSTVDSTYLEESRYIPYQTEIIVVEPTYSHLATLFEETKQAPTWSFFSPPSNFYSQSNRFFGNSLIPDLDPAGLMEKYEHALEIFLSSNTDIPPQASDRIHALLETLDCLDTLLKEGNACRIRYKKG